MDRTEAQTRKLLAALPAPGYDIGVLSERGMYRLEAVSAFRVLRLLPYLKHRNANGAHIYTRPTGESAYTLLDDLTAVTLPRLTAEGFAPAAVIETSPGSFQAWLRHNQPLPKDLGTLAAKTLAERFGTDRSAADWRRFGRMPGSTNRKPEHRNGAGLYPFARLHSHTGQPFPAALAFHEELLESAAEQEAERRRACVLYRARLGRFPSAPLTLSRFRNDLRYRKRSAAADMAFAICACAHGWPESDIAAALAAEYLSRDSNQPRQAAYIQRTLAKAILWAA